MWTMVKEIRGFDITSPLVVTWLLELCFREEKLFPATLMELLVVNRRPSGPVYDYFLAPCLPSFLSAPGAASLRATNKSLSFRLV